MYNRRLGLNQYGIVITALLSVGLALFTGDALATTITTIGSVATQITTSFAQLAKLITATAYLAGMGFAVGSIIKFKAHKDNPAQVTIGMPVGLLMVAAALIFLPTILGVTGQTIFGSSSPGNSVTGVSSF